MHLLGATQPKCANAVCTSSQAALFRHRVPCIGIAPVCIIRQRVGSICSTANASSSHSHASAHSPTWEQVKQAANLCRNMPVVPGSPGSQGSSYSQFSAASSNMHASMPHGKGGSPAPYVRMSAMGHVYEPHGDPEDDELIWMREELSNQSHEQHADGESIDIDPDAAERLVEHERLRRALRLIRDPLAQMTPSPSRQRSPTVPLPAVPFTMDVDVTKADLGMQGLKRQSPSLRDIQVHVASSYQPRLDDGSSYTTPAPAQATNQHDRLQESANVPGSPSSAVERRPDIPSMNTKAAQEVPQSSRVYGGAMSQQVDSSSLPSSELLDLDSPGGDTVSWQGGQPPDATATIAPTPTHAEGRQWSGEPCILQPEVGIIDRTADFGDPDDINMVMHQMQAEELPAGQAMAEDAADLNGAVGPRS